ncbi:hypothetical protein, partial [Reyranella soli]|uniref:hypothetical protein n=1 Tax=Reyranella soli TaxID=1230389 RepID=UPI0011BD79AB
MNYDIDAPGPRKPRPIASSPFWMGSCDANATPGFSIAPPSDQGFKIPTPMGWLSPEMLRNYANGMAPNREAIADTLGIPMDGVAWAARQLGAKGISGGYGKPDPLTQLFAVTAAMTNAPPLPDYSRLLRHNRVALMYSGGKDSDVLLSLFAPFLEGI